MTEIFGENLIDAYSRADMIEDGSLIDVTSMAKEVGFRFPVAVTNAVWIRSIQPYDGEIPDLGKKSGALWDCLWMLYIGLRHSKSEKSEFLFPVTVKGENGEFLIATLKAVIGPDDEGEPVITIMEREEE